MRRLVAVALGAFMLHLNVVRADRACATHAHTTVGSSDHAMDASHGAHNMTRADNATVARDASCDTPLQADCCLTLASCSITLGLHDAQAISVAFESDAAVVSTAQRAP